VVEAFGGGVFEMVRTLSEGLARHGDAVAIAYGVRPETPGDVRDRIDAEVELFPTPWLRRTARAQLGAARAIRRLAGEWDPDVIHLHSSFAGLVGTLALARRAPLVYTPHGYSFTMGDQGGLRRGAYRAMERLVARRVAVLGAVSESEAALAREVVRAPRVEVVANGIPELDPGSIPDPTDRPVPRVIAMGRIDAARQPDACGRILAGVADLAKVAWVGGGGRRGGDPSPLNSRGVETTGWLEREAALGWLAKSTAYLHWAAWDGQPLAVLEAMARDVVVVASDIDPIRELLGPGHVRSTEDEAIALLRSILTDRDVREAMLRSQRRRRAHYAAERMVRQWRELYGALGREPAR
jgi:glycosyltransferase involved in cell wall biosynthesis